MISISRSMARQFRAVARRAGLHKANSVGTPCIRLIATADSLRMHITNGHTAVEYRCAGQFDATDISVPFQLFTDCDAKSDTPVTIRMEEPNRLVATWNDRGVPQQRNYDFPATPPEMATLSCEFSTNDPGLLVALREAKATVDASSSRYSLDCLQLKGATGTIVATDSRQLLLQTGFQFPWQEDLLMRATDVFASRELPSESPVEIGRTEQGITVRIGEWTIHHEIDSQGRYPKLNHVIPASDAIATRMQIDATDAKFLTDTVNRLPADELTDRPLTVDLNGSVAVRARNDEQSPMTELILSRSQRIGNQLRLQTNRAFLVRALQLGFREIGFVDAHSPCICQDATRTYMWMLLENKGALEPNANALRIDSMSMTPNGSAKRQGNNSGVVSTARSGALTTISTSNFAPAVTPPVNRVSQHLPHHEFATSSGKNESTLSPVLSQSTDLIEQALELRNQLRLITQGLTELVAQIRHQKKQTRLMKSTLQSLQQLQLLEV